MSDPLMHIAALFQNGTTGHLTLHAYIVDTDKEGNETCGPVETHGIDPLALKSLYGETEADPVSKWLASVKERMSERHQIRMGMHANLHQRIGQRI